MQEEATKAEGMETDAPMEQATGHAEESTGAVVREAAVKAYAAESTQRSATRRYHLAVSEDLMQALQDVAKRQGVSVADVLRKFIKLGLFIDRLEGRSDVEILIKEGEQYQRLILF